MSVFKGFRQVIANTCNLAAYLTKIHLTKYLQNKTHALP